MKPIDKASRDDRWLLRSRELLDRQAAEADPVLQRRLRQIREQALDAPAGRPSLRLAGLALAGSAAALLLSVGLLRGPGGPSAGDAPATPAEQAALRADSPIEQALTLPEEDLALLAGEVDPDLLEELEFYAWLELQDHDI